MSRNQNYQTAVTQLGRNPKRDHGSVNPPVYHTSTLIFDDFAQLQDYEQGRTQYDGYARHNNPTMQALAESIAQLEGYESCYITASGLSATVTAILSQVNAGDHILISDSIYSHTRKFVKTQLPRLGIDVTFYNPTIGQEVEALFKPNTKAIYVESPGSLTFEMQDVPLLAKIAHSKGATVISDSTWATPFLQDAPALGIDVSIQSVTKYIAGHSDLVMGSVSASGEYAKKLKEFYLLTGPCAGTDNIFLALRGLRSVIARLPIHQRSALQIATWLETRSEVARVLFPALPSNPGHELFKRDLTGSCGLFAFEMKDATQEKVGRFIDSLHHFGLGYSWGGFESLVTAYRPAPQRDAPQWDENCWLIRLNVGLESTDDLQEDLERGFSAIG